MSRALDFKMPHSLTDKLLRNSTNRVANRAAQFHVSHLWVVVAVGECEINDKPHSPSFLLKHSQHLLRSEPGGER